MAIVAVLTFYLGLLNTLVSRFAGTCTQGDADRLWGVALSVPLFFVAVAGLLMTRNLKYAVLAALPGILLMLWQGAFAAKLSSGILIHQVSACEVLEGIPYGQSGNEMMFALLWPAVIFGAITGMASVIVIRRMEFH